MKNWTIFIVCFTSIFIWYFRRPICAKIYMLFYFGLVRPILYGDRVCFYSVFAFLFTGAKKHSDILIYRCGKIYIIKQLGCVRKLTNIISEKPGQLEYVKLMPMPLMIYNPASESRSKAVQFDLTKEKISLYRALWANTNIKATETCLLLFPKPLNFSQRVNGENVVFYSGDRWNGDLLYTIKRFRKMLKSGTSSNRLSRKEWVAIKRSYRRS